jgi:hypothetical protein
MPSAEVWKLKGRPPRKCSRVSGIFPAKKTKKRNLVNDKNCKEKAVKGL